MTSSLLKTKRSAVARGDARFAARNEQAAARRYKPVRTLTQFDFRTPADRVAKRWRAVGLLTLLALTVAGAIAGVAYVAGMVAAGIVAAAGAALIAFGNWILNNIIEL